MTSARHRQSRRRYQPFLDAMVPWIPMVVGIVVMAGYMVYATALSISHRALPAVPADPGAYEVPAAPTPAPATSVPSTGPAAVTMVPARAAPPVVSPSASPTPSPTPPASSAPPPPAPAPELVGTYRLDAEFQDVFIGKVTIVNQSARAQDWTVEVAFPASVGNLNTFWVDGTPQPVMVRSGDGYRFTSTVPVEAGGSVVLKFHFDRNGLDITPTLCTVNGSPCALS